MLMWVWKDAQQNLLMQMLVRPKITHRCTSFNLQSTAIIFPNVVMLSRLPVGEARDTLDNTQENNHTHSQLLQRSGQSPIHPSSKCMFLGGSQSTRREPTHTHTHGENMQTPQRNPWPHRPSGCEATVLTPAPQCHLTHILTKFVF